MADATAKKLLQLLSPKTPGELRCAAAAVLAEVGSPDAQLSQALCEGLEDPDPAFRSQAIQAVGKLKVEAALPRLLARVEQGGPEAETAALAAARLGARGTRALRELMPAVAPGLRRRIASALGAGGSPSAESAAVDALLDADPGVVDAAARSLIGEVPSLSEAHRRSLARHVLELLGGRKEARLPAASEAALVRLLAALGDPLGEAAFWARVEPPHPPELRAAALQALGTLPPPAKADRLKRLFACAADPDFRVAAPALMILKAVPVNGRNLADWLTLLEAADPAARRFGIEKVGETDSAEVAAALAAQVGHRDRGVREDALARLARLDKGREALAGALLDAASPDEGWDLARAQAPFVRDYAPGLRARVFARMCAFLDADDRRADPLVFLLREADPRDLRDRLEERSLALRKKKQYAQALVYLRLLTRDPACAEAVRFEHAACSLKLSARDLAPESRAADPALRQFAGLLHRHETDPAERVSASAKWLEPEDLFYLGFHFAEGNRQEKEFGGEVLRLLMTRSARSKLAKDAKSKLRSQGLA